MRKVLLTLRIVSVICCILMAIYVLTMGDKKSVYCNGDHGEHYITNLVRFQGNYCSKCGSSKEDTGYLMVDSYCSNCGKTSYIYTNEFCTECGGTMVNNVTVLYKDLTWYDKIFKYYVGIPGGLLFTIFYIGIISTVVLFCFVRDKKKEDYDDESREQ